ncbi:hypothetical protein JANAI62_02240 [Jannaschia pagri]|uniref:VWFA domain-containing protein n=1 Tax=Jannaschia pagri TaxID=2829797 RepID=A0ABQ4NH46_9RHOB|nr:MULTISPECIES: vWA domain-containing protein [unclassified Jannaschia]GIT90293.1 hypothetical protein JANAI61_07510 [Jannaschia sp. AI_61]GIT93601.1 hypothetical protein JANAI62_02240 [Jannaschia sp. AI_62]
MHRFVSFLAATALSTQTALASCTADAILIFDGSNSMGGIGYATEGLPRIDEARTAVARALPPVEHIRRIGLMTYGPGRQTFCDGIHEHFAPQPLAAAPILSALEDITPMGLTPLAEAVRQAADRLRYRERAGVIVLVTDGNDTCGGMPCALADRLSATAQDLTIHVVGFKVVGDLTNGGSAATRPLPRGEIIARCLAERTGGLYVLSDTIDDLVEALNETLGCRDVS